MRRSYWLPTKMSSGLQSGGGLIGIVLSLELIDVILTHFPSSSARCELLPFLWEFSLCSLHVYQALSLHAILLGFVPHLMKSTLYSAAEPSNGDTFADIVI